MKLTQNQLQQIEAYLNFRELTHLDLKNEVLDHMATDIEKQMGQGSNFKKAKKNVISDWNLELSEHSSWLIGWVWTGPRIMIDKGVKKTKQIYVNTLFMTLVVALIIHLSYRIFNVVESGEFLNVFIGSAYIVILFLTLFFFWKIKATNFESTYSFLFRINAIGFAFMYVVLNPLLPESFLVFGMNETYYLTLFYNSFLLSFTYSYWDLFKSHINLKKLAFS
jgi:hypothetical protein